MSGGDKQAWSDYWAHAPASGACVPGAPEPALRRFQECWRRFFVALPMGAAVLDLGTGAGAVPRFGHGLRPDLAFTGVDYADRLPPAPPAVRLVPGVDFKALPFPDRSFGAITAQFALEYGADAQALAEIGRVLAPGGRLMVLAHHRAGVLVRHNSARAAAIEDILSPGSLMAESLRLVAFGKGQSLAGRQQMTALLKAVQARHPGQGVVMDVAVASASVMAAPDAMARLERLEHDVRMEQARLVAMKQAALDEKAARQMRDRLAITGPVNLSVLDLPEGGEILAWCFETVA